MTGDWTFPVSSDLPSILDFRYADVSRCFGEVVSRGSQFLIRTSCFDSAHVDSAARFHRCGPAEQHRENRSEQRDPSGFPPLRDGDPSDEFRNILFGPPTDGGLDLASLNTQRGRDHGLPDYASAVFARGLGRIHSFADISSDPVVQSLLAAQYGDIHEIDLWVGGISEDPVNGGHVGELFFNILKSQFEALRDGDRYWYEIALPIDEVIEIENTTLADVIRRNTAIDTEIDDDVFHVN
ncbi:MAG: peroxidase family protein [Polyangiales bacterium]